MFALLASASPLCATAAPQSGRRVREPRTAEPAQPAPVITPKIATEPANRRNLPDIPIAVAGHVGSKVARARAGAIYNNFAARLGEFMKVTSLGLAKRDEAVRRARGAGWQYVVFLEMEFEPLRDGRIVFSSPDIVVNYTVIDAVTGNSKKKGKIYYRPNGGPAGEPIKITPEAAGEEAAELVLDWFSLPSNVEK
ncbi:MAG TPA: hypothetical protein VK421_13140 [Pyrinomonadaceae bacterium]|nr:hypothetical protein [Pyrinomonadaceae bacterium]